MVFWAVFSLKVLLFLTRPPPGEERAKQEVPEGSTREGKVHCVESCKDKGNRRSDGNNAQHWGHREVPCIYPRTLSLRNHFLGWERGRLQKKPFLVVRPERQGKARAWFRAEKNLTNTTEEGGVVQSYLLHLHIVMSHDLKSCIYEQTQNSTFRWL